MAFEDNANYDRANHASTPDQADLYEEDNLEDYQRHVEAQTQQGPGQPKKKGCLSGCLKGCGCLVVLGVAALIGCGVYLFGSSDLAGPQEFVAAKHSALAVVTLDAKDAGVKELMGALDKLWQEEAAKDPDFPGAFKGFATSNFLPLRAMLLLEPGKSLDQAKPLVVLSLGKMSGMTKLLFGLTCFGIEHDDKNKGEVRTRGGQKLIVFKEPSGAVKSAVAIVRNNVLISDDPAKVEAALDALAKGGEAKGPIVATKLHNMVDHAQDGYGIVTNTGGQLDNVLERIYKEAPRAKRLNPGDITNLGWDGDIVPGDKLRLRLLLECRDTQAAARVRSSAAQLGQEIAKREPKVSFIGSEAKDDVVTVTVEIADLSKTVEQKK